MRRIERLLAPLQGKVLQISSARLALLAVVKIRWELPIQAPDFILLLPFVVSFLSFLDDQFARRLLWRDFLS